METERSEHGASAPEPNGNRHQGDRDELRLRHGVRLVTHDEEGFALQRLPDGVYGFTCAPGQSEMPVFAKQSLHGFEAHKDSEGAEYLIGFVTQPEAEDLASGRDGSEIALFPEEWGSSTQIVAAPLSRIAPHKRSLPREDGNPFKFTLI
jgi:hypothetical protein